MLLFYLKEYVKSFFRLLLEGSLCASQPPPFTSWPTLRKPNLPDFRPMSQAVLSELWKNLYPNSPLLNLCPKMGNFEEIEEKECTRMEYLIYRPRWSTQTLGQLDAISATKLLAQNKFTTGNRYGKYKAALQPHDSPENTDSQPIDPLQRTTAHCDGSTASVVRKGRRSQTIELTNVDPVFAAHSCFLN